MLPRCAEAARVDQIGGLPKQRHKLHNSHSPCDRPEDRVHLALERRRNDTGEEEGNVSSGAASHGSALVPTVAWLSLHEAWALRKAVHRCWNARRIHEWPSCAKVCQRLYVEPAAKAVDLIDENNQLSGAGVAWRKAFEPKEEIVV